MKACIQCGAELQDDDVFCTNCGTRQPDPELESQQPDQDTQSQQPANSEVCPNCGQPVDENMQFCISCGAKLHSGTDGSALVGGTSAATAPIAVVSPVTTAPNDRSAEVPQPVQPIQQPPVQPLPVQPPAQFAAPSVPSDAAYAGASPVPPAVQGEEGGFLEEEDKPKRGRIIAIIVAAIVVLAIIGGLVWWFVWGRESGNDSSQQAQSQTTSSASATPESSSDSSKGTDKDSSDTTCSTISDARVEKVAQQGNSLVAYMNVDSSCDGDKQQFKESGIKVSVKDSDGDVIASAVFDFSKKPITLSKGKASDVALEFGSRQYWRPADQMTTDNTEVVWQKGQQGSGGAADGDALTGGDISSEDAERYAQLALSWQLKHDATAVQALQGQSTTQLSSKKFDMDADGKVWKYLDIYEQFLTLHVKHPKTVLLWGADYSYYTRNGHAADYYVMLSGETFGSQDDANAWCPANGYDANNCIGMTLD